MQNLHCHSLLFLFFFLLSVFSISSFSVNSYGSPPSQKGLQYHMGPVLTSPIKLYIIWYGKWEEEQASIIRDFLNSFSSPFPPPPSVVDWWKIVRLYTDQTGSNITASLTLAAESHDLGYSHGVRLRRLDIQSVIGTAVARGALPLDTRNGFYLVLTSSEVGVQDFCMAICGFHYYTFPTVVGATVPFAWVGNSGTQCPGTCAYPFVRPEGSTPLPPAPPGRDDGYNSTMGAPNGDTGVDGMISVIAHELAEASSDPLMSGWYAGKDSTAPTEIADMCEGVYGIGGGSGYVGEVERDKEGRVYNLNGAGGRRFLVQWVYDLSKGCDGPNNVHN